MEDWHPIKVVARRTGLSPHVIRAWEKRYHAVTPQRTETNRRVYSGADIERLVLLRRATLGGRSIGQVAALPTAELRELVRADESAERSAPVGPSSPRAKDPSAARTLQQSLDAVGNLDPEALSSSLEQASVALSRPVLLHEVISPLLHQVGQAWENGTLRVAHEHLASAIVRTFLANINGRFPESNEQPNLLVTTPAGQLHELGALLVATTGASLGWRVTYLGPNLPAEEIASAVQQRRARAVALSIIYPPDDLHLKEELRHLARLLSEDQVPLLVGGRSATGYAEVLDEIRALKLDDLDALRTHLNSLRSGAIE